MTAEVQPEATGRGRGGPGWWVLSGLLVAAVWWLSSRGHTPLPTPHPVDWAAHLLTSLALAFCLGRATGRWQTALLLAAWFGALDEVHLAFVPPRESGIGNWWFDLFGALLGAKLAAGKRPHSVTEAESPEMGPHVDFHFDE